MTYRAFLDDSSHITALEGQRFVVLRARGRPAEEFERVLGVLRARLAGADVSYPAQPHVTLAGFAAGTPIEAVQAIVGAWSQTVAPLRIELERVTIFPPPFQILVLQVRKTPELFAALVDLRRRASESGLVLSTVVAPDAWIFHMSVVYGARLDTPAWDDLAAFSRELSLSPAHHVAGEAEIVMFDRGLEYSGGVYPFGARGWLISDEGGVRMVEGLPDRTLVDQAQDGNRLIEACAEAETDALLLHPANLPPAFFDLSSREAGEILQKLRNYGLRLALVCEPGSVRFSSRFGEALAEERDRGWFGVFDTRADAVAWLAASGGGSRSESDG